MVTIANFCTNLTVVISKPIGKHLFSDRLHTHDS